jgi:hypothetical protein
MTGNQHVINTGSNDFDVVVTKYGDAAGTKDQFKNSDPSKIDPLVQENYSTYACASQQLAAALQKIRRDLAACWTGENANNALQIVDTLMGDADTIGTNANACKASFDEFQKSWSTLKGRAENLDDGFAFTRLGADDGQAHEIYKQFNDAMDTAMHAMPSQLVYHTPLTQGDDHNQTPGGPGPGPGNFGPGPGPGSLGPGNYGPGPASGPGHYGPGPGDGPGNYGPGNGPGYGPGSYGPGGYGPGSYGPGQGSYGSGYGTDPSNVGSSLAGYDGGAAGSGGFGPGGGLGAGGLGAGGLGAGGGLGSGAAGGAMAGGGVGGGVGVGVGGGGAAGPGAGGGRGGMMMPMHGAGQNGDQDRDRSTWLSEDDSVWGADEAPPGLIT